MRARSSVAGAVPEPFEDPTDEFLALRGSSVGRPCVIENCRSRGRREDWSEEMRKLVTSFLMTINGVIGNPHEWAAEFDRDAAERALDQLRKSHAMLMGRRTYEIFSERWPGSIGEYPDAINAIKKYVFSNTLDEAGWTNVTIVRGDPVQEVARIKEEGGEDLVLYGHGMLGRALLENGLVDE